MKTRVLDLGQLCLSLTFCLGLTACNQDGFYEKEYLENPDREIATTGSSNGGNQGGIDSGVDGGATQGGVSGGVNGGTDGSTTNGSSTGGVDGSTVGGSTGSTTAGVDGSTVGGSTGGTTGGVDGSTVGGSTGGTTGGVDGSTVGGSTGSTTAGVDGSTVGGSTGGTTGGTTGSTVGGTTGGTIGDCNNGHGNDADGIDESNPTIGTESKCKRDKFKQATANTKKLDIVWIIDNSGSMADEQDDLGYNFDAFINEFIDRDVDFKMAITTTDTSSSSKKGAMVSGSDTKLTSAKAKANPVQFKKDFRSLVKVGTKGSGAEKGLEASEGFMSKYASSFVRKDAYLAVVVLSDEEDQSSKTVATYTNNLKSYKNEAGLVKVYSIVDTGMTNKGGGISTGYQRYAQASKNTAGIVANIRDDFYKSLGDMGDSILNLLDSFALSSEPIESTIRVFVDGVETRDFSYDAQSQSIKFNQNNLPKVGADITVTYVKK